MSKVIKKLIRWWDCADKIEAAEMEIKIAKTETNRLVDVLRFIGKQHPDIILLLDESQRNKQFETIADVIFISGNDIYIDNIRVEFENEDNGKVLLVSGINNLTIMNTQFYTKKDEKNERRK